VYDDGEDQSTLTFFGEEWKKCEFRFDLPDDHHTSKE
jgi:hypothetical protein